jgi:hypothetical protein
VLVGVGHIRVVRELTEAWETAVEEDRMGLVVAEGPTGIGKTAVVQALYEQLAMRQARPAYWPPTFNERKAAGMRNVSPAGSEDTGRPGPASASPGPVSRRARAERIYPLLDMEPAEGSSPEFFWWGLTARLGESAVLTISYEAARQPFAGSVPGLSGYLVIGCCLCAGAGACRADSVALIAARSRRAVPGVTGARSARAATPQAPLTPGAVPPG